MKFNPVLIIVLVIAMFIMYRRYSEGLPMMSGGCKIVKTNKYLGNYGDDGSGR